MFRPSGGNNEIVNKEMFRLWGGNNKIVNKEMFRLWGERSEPMLYYIFDY